MFLYVVPILNLSFICSEEPKQIYRPSKWNSNTNCGGLLLKQINITYYNTILLIVVLNGETNT